MARYAGDRLNLSAAAALLAGDIAKLSDEQVVQCYDAYASHISYLHADDYGGDWKLVPQYRPRLDMARAELNRRSIEVPNGYLL